jgi:manganese/zinc/iron transport system permease protein
MFDGLAQALASYTLRNVVLSCALLGIISGVLGSFAVLRRQALTGDVIAHAAFPGISLAFLFGGPGAPLLLTIGAAISASAGLLTVAGILRRTRLKPDAALSIVLSVTFGVGTVLLTLARKQGAAARAGLDHFLFGQAATLTTPDMQAILALGTGVLVVTFLLFKEFAVFTFDPAFAASLGRNTNAITLALTGLTVLTIVLGLRSVGIVLMTSLFIGPAVAARQWTERLSTMCLLAGLFGGLAGAGGALISASGARLPTGPMIVLCVSAIALFSVMFGPARGWLRTRLSHRARP